MGTRLGVRAPCEQRARAPRVKNGLISCSWLHLLKVWSLLKTRGDSHNTLLLEALEFAAEKFWSRYTPLDETTHPRKEAVVEELVSKHGVSAHVAGVIFTILRADELPQGRPIKYKMDD